METFVPQTQVLQHCAVVVSHAGSATMLASLELGIPQLCLPQGADQYLNAAPVAKAGAGLQLHPGMATPYAIAAAVQLLLDEGAFRTAAERVGASIARMPTTDEVAGVLEQLARS